MLADNIKLLTILVIVLVVCVILTVKIPSINTITKDDSRGGFYSTIGMYLGWLGLAVTGSILMIKGFKKEYYDNAFFGSLVILLFSSIFLFIGYSCLRKSDNYNSNITQARWIIFMAIIMFVSFAFILVFFGSPVLYKYMMPETPVPDNTQDYTKFLDLSSIQEIPKA